MLDLIWEVEARARLGALLDFISLRNDVAAEGIRQRIDDMLEAARQTPGIGRPGRVRGTRELIAHPNYIFIYRAKATTITVLRVLHARQRYP